MASMERGFSFSFRKHEGHMFFIYDHRKKKEEDDPKDAILYFYPRSVKTDDQIALVGGIIGITDFCLEFLPQQMPQIVKLSAHNFALLQHGDYIIGLAGSVDIPTNFLLIHMQFLWSTFVFYQGSITALRQRQPEEQFLRKLNMVWDIYLPLCQSQGDLLGQAFQTIPYIKLHRSQGSLFLHASHILQRSLKQNGVLAGALFSKNKVLCTQLSNVLTRKLLLLMMQTQFPSVDVNSNLELPGGVHLIHVYMTPEEYRSLNHRRKKRYSNSLLQTSLEENEIAKMSTSAEVKKSVFSDSAISSGGEQVFSHSTSLNTENNPVSSCDQSPGRNDNFGDTSSVLTHSHTEDDSENYTDTISDKAVKTVIGNEGESVSRHVNNKAEQERNSHVGAFGEVNLSDNVGEHEKDKSVESLTNSLNNNCDNNMELQDESNDNKSHNSSILGSSESNSSKLEHVCSTVSSNGSVSLNDEERNSSPSGNSGDSSSFDGGKILSSNDKSEKSSNDNKCDLSQNNETDTSLPVNRFQNDSSSSVGTNGIVCSNRTNENSSQDIEERSNDASEKDLKDSNSDLTQSKLSTEHRGKDDMEVNRKLDLKIVNNNLHFPSLLDGSKACPNSSNISVAASQPNQDIMGNESSQNQSSSEVFISGEKTVCLRRHLSLESSLGYPKCVDVDDSFHYSSHELKKEDDNDMSRKSSVNSLANSDVPSSKDRLTFENMDSENSDFGLVSPDSEFHPSYQGNSLQISLSSLKEADVEDVNYGSFHSCQEGDGGMTARSVNEVRSSSDPKSSKWTSQQDNLSEMNLYIQGHSDTLLVLLIEKEVTCSKSYIHSLWKSCLSHLGELDFEVKNVERHSQDDSENIGALYQYMKYDSFSQSLNGSALLPVTSLANEMVDSCVRMHKDFTVMPDLVDATYRSHTACSFARRSLNSETYFQIGLPSRGGVNPGEKTFHLEQTAEKCLVLDHKVNLL